MQINAHLCIFKFKKKKYIYISVCVCLRVCVCACSSCTSTAQANHEALVRQSETSIDTALQISGSGGHWLVRGPWCATEIATFREKSSALRWVIVNLSIQEPRILQRSQRKASTHMIFGYLLVPKRHQDLRIAESFLIGKHHLETRPATHHQQPQFQT